MKIILLKSVRGLGNPGEIVNVKSGYARNYLIPSDLAIYATKANISQTEYTIQKSKEAEEKRVEELTGVAAKLDLARAYLAMQDYQQMREVLQAVLQQGNSQQKQQAQDLLDKIPESS